MTTLEVEFDILPGGKSLIDHMTKINRHVENMTPAMRAIMASFHAIERERFANEGPGWEPLAPSTITYRISHRFNAGPILFRTGTLEDSFTGGGNSTNVATSNFMEVTSHVEYANFHQDGGPNLPQRQIIHLNENTLLLWREILQVYIMTGATGSVSDDAIAMAL